MIFINIVFLTSVITSIQLYLVLSNMASILNKIDDLLDYVQAADLESEPEGPAVSNQLDIERMEYEIFMKRMKYKQRKQPKRETYDADKQQQRTGPLIRCVFNGLPEISQQTGCSNLKARLHIGAGANGKSAFAKILKKAAE